jgi:Gluconate 2-dehydrogenase subunit 3
MYRQLGGWSTLADLSPDQSGEAIMDETTFAIGRRALLQTLAGGAGLGLALPGLGEAHPMSEHLHDQARVSAADAKAKSKALKPEFLDAHQVETLTLLAEQIVPGSTKARSAEFIDALLAVDTEPRQKRFLQALGAFDGVALAEARKPWKALPEADRTALLTKASTAESGTPSGPGAGFAAPPAEPSGDQRFTIRDHFDHLKGWISGAYYSSEIGMRELGWTGNVMFEKFTGCQHGGSH